MVGQLNLYRIAPRDYDHWENSDDDEEGDYFGYTYSYWNELQGEILRAAITYLEYIQKVRAGNVKKGAKDGAKALFLDFGLRAIQTCENDKEALKVAGKLLKDALDVLNGWKKPKQHTETPSFSSPFQTMMLDIMSGAAMSFRQKEIAQLEGCPLELARIGMGGVYTFLLLPDSSQVIYSGDAQFMAMTFSRILKHVESGKGARPEFDNADEENWEIFLESLGKLVNVFEKCNTDKFIQG